MNTGWNKGLLAVAMVAATQAMGCQASVGLGVRSTGTSSALAANTCAAPGEPAPTFDWSPARRAAFDRAARNGVVVVQQRGCDWVVLEGCGVREGTAGYQWQPAFRREANGAGSEGQMGLDVGGRGGGAVSQGARSGEEVVTVGVRELSADLTGADLVGACAGATHVVRHMEVGAFRVTNQSVSGNRVTVGFGGYATKENWDGKLHQEGHPERCVAASPSAATPAECSAAVSVAFAPIRPAPAIAAPAALRAPASAATPLVVAAGAPTCASGNAAQCTADCNAGDWSACSALTVLCARGNAAACPAMGAAWLAAWGGGAVARQ